MLQVSLVRRFPGVGYTFMLAGALKIMTVGWIATGAPRECVRTAAGGWREARVREGVLGGV